MNKLLEVRNCWECKHKLFYDAERFCEKAGKLIEDIASGLPEWCPLPDAPHPDNKDCSHDSSFTRRRGVKNPTA